MLIHLYIESSEKSYTLFLFSTDKGYIILQRYYTGRYLDSVWPAAGWWDQDSY